MVDRQRRKTLKSIRDSLIAGLLLQHRRPTPPLRGKVERDLLVRSRYCSIHGTDNAIRVFPDDRPSVRREHRYRDTTPNEVC
jgi:hypothetical protein